MNKENKKYIEHRTIEEKTTKAIFGSIKDFEKYWIDKNEKFIEKNPSLGTHEEAIEISNNTIRQISSAFQEGDEIIHFDDYGVALPSCEREFVLIRRNGKVVKSELIRMS